LSIRAMRAKPYLKEISLKNDKIQNHNEYPFNIPAIQKLKTIKFHPDVTFLVGENGAGKSTLIEAIAMVMGFGAEGGTKNMQVQTVETISLLHQYVKVTKSYKYPKDFYFLRAESFYNVATYVDHTGYLQGYGNRSLHQRSHGEAFMATLTMKLRGEGLYLFDEPEAALSPTRQMSAITAIDQLVKNESQFIIATHSPILLAYPNAKILYFNENGIQEISYEDTEHYSVTREFLNNYRRMIEILISEE